MSNVKTYTIETYKDSKHIHTVHGVRDYRVDGLIECWECREGDQCELKASVGVCKETAAWENLKASGTHDFRDHVGTLWCLTVENLRHYDAR